MIRLPHWPKYTLPLDNSVLYTTPTAHGTNTLCFFPQPSFSGRPLSTLEHRLPNFEGAVNTAGTPCRCATFLSRCVTLYIKKNHRSHVGFLPRLGLGASKSFQQALRHTDRDLPRVPSLCEPVDLVAKTSHHLVRASPHLGSLHLSQSLSLKPSSG